MISTRLQEAQPDYNKGQDATASNRRSNQQTQRGKIFQ